MSGESFLQHRTSITGLIEDHAQDMVYTASNTAILFQNAIMRPSS
jgi:hypothetical protein